MAHLDGVLGRLRKAIACAQLFCCASLQSELSAYDDHQLLHVDAVRAAWSRIKPTAVVALIGITLCERVRWFAIMAIFASESHSPLADIHCDACFYTSAGLQRGTS